MPESFRFGTIDNDWYEIGYSDPHRESHRITEMLQLQMGVAVDFDDGWVNFIPYSQIKIIKWKTTNE